MNEGNVVYLFIFIGLLLGYLAYTYVTSYDGRQRESFLTAFPYQADKMEQGSPNSNSPLSNSHLAS